VGVAGAGRSIHDPMGENIKHYAWCLEKVSNNQVESYVLWCGLNLPRKLGIRSLMVWGDSLIITRVFIK
jgi:hypothetical protein